MSNTSNNILSPQGSACSAKGGVNEDSENDLAIGTYDESDLVWIDKLNHQNKVTKDPFFVLQSWHRIKSILEVKFSVFKSMAKWFL